MNFFNILNKYADNAELVCDEIADLLADNLDAESIDYVEYDGDNSFRVIMSASTHMQDDGIGVYEWWGHEEVHHDWVPYLDDEGAFDLEPCEKALADAGIKVTNISDADEEYDGCVEDGDKCCATAFVEIDIVDADKFEKWLATRNIKVAA